MPAAPKPKMQPRKPKQFVKRVNQKRAAIRRARDFGSVADWIVTLPCCVCGKRTGETVKAEGYSSIYYSVLVDAAHVQSRGAGGRKESNLIPLARHLHDRQHAKGWEAIGLTRQKAAELAKDYQRLFDERFGKPTD